MKQLLTAFLALACVSLQAQTLFHYGKDSVTAREFLTAYHKNNSGANTPKTLRDYLDLYIASRLKIQEAKDEGYDTLPQIAADGENLRKQILPSYVNDKQSIDKLIDEAYTRSAKDIHLAHIFLRNSSSVTEMEERKQAVMNALRTMSFGQVAAKYSDDPSAASNQGDLGWITVFSLPYTFENLAYKTAVGETVTYQSKAGFHFIKNLGERKDPGRVKAAQILLAFPPEADAAAKASIRKLADSLYLRLTKGDDFGKLATQFSNDIVSAAANGQMQEFGTGQFDPLFETQVYALSTDGAYSKPFATSYGYHIVKRISRVPAALVKNEKTTDAFRDKVENSDRVNSVKIAQAEKIRKTTGMTVLPETQSRLNELFLYTDSVLVGRKNNIQYSLDSKTPLLRFPKKEVRVAEWIGYAQTNRYMPNGVGEKSNADIWSEFQDAMALQYYEDHLEDFNSEFRSQLAEFSEGNLFFEIMQRKVWGPAQTDSAALQNFYASHKAKYTWKPSADAVLFYATDLASAKEFSKDLKKNPAMWQSVVFNYTEKIASDSSRIELNQIPNPGKIPLLKGTITDPLVNATDKTASLAYIIRLHPEPSLRSFSEARGLVINDYQMQLEKEWLADLRNHYPVVVNEKLFDTMVKEKKYL